MDNLAVQARPVPSVAPRTPRTRSRACLGCGEEFEPRREWHSYCSDACRAKEWRQGTLDFTDPEERERERIRYEAEREQKRKARGMAVAAANNDEWVERVHRLAVDLALRHPERLCCMNDVRHHYERVGIEVPWGPWAGSIFKGASWEFTGDRRAAQYARSHGREVKVWRLR